MFFFFLFSSLKKKKRIYTLMCTHIYIKMKDPKTGLVWKSGKGDRKVKEEKIPWKKMWRCHIGKWSYNTVFQAVLRSCPRHSLEYICCINVSLSYLVNIRHVILQVQLLLLVFQQLHVPYFWQKLFIIFCSFYYWMCMEISKWKLLP